MPAQPLRHKFCRRKRSEAATSVSSNHGWLARRLTIRCPTNPVAPSTPARIFLPGENCRDWRGHACSLLTGAQQCCAPTGLGAMRVPRTCGLNVLRTQTVISVSWANGQNARVQNFRAAQRQGMGVLVTEVVQEPRLRGLDRIGGCRYRPTSVQITSSSASTT